MIWPRIVISALIAGAGLGGAYTLTTVDQELRVLYAEYTLATTDLGHINAQLIRYRTSVLRAIEADSREEYQRIVDALPLKRNRIEQPLERFIKAALATASTKSEAIEELAELRAVKARVAEYMATSDQTVQLLNQRWQTASPGEVRRLRDLAEENAAKRAGEKFVAVTLELDHLLDVVAKIAGEARSEADRQLRIMSAIVIAVSSFLIGLVLFTKRD